MTLFEVGNGTSNLITDGHKGQPKRGGSMRESTAEKQQKQKDYEEYIKQVTPVHSLWLQMLKAFITGGIICCVGQFILNSASGMGLDDQTAGSWCSLILVLASVVLTGFGIYPKIVKWGGAGALVPITGFANSVAAPAIEYKVQGQVFGIGCNIFTIAGPVILYGIFASWLLGLGYWILQLAGIV
jgi:stage V sporulation protein AC